MPIHSHYADLAAVWRVECCLGTMTWGQQNSEQDAHTQLSYAFDLGVNFMDTAEMYAKCMHYEWLPAQVSMLLHNFTGILFLQRLKPKGEQISTLAAG